MKFIIWVDEFDDQIGGNIALHLLCRRLNDIGHTARIWPAGWPSLSRARTVREVLRWGHWTLGGRNRRPFNFGPFGNALAKERDLWGAVAVYPEIVAGNPLRSRHVVRWLLNKPGFFTGEVNYGAEDLFFHYQEAFEDPAYPSRRLTLTWINETYRNLILPERSGSAYLVRKGKNRPIVHDLRDSICVDGMSHEECAAVFNKVKYFYCYDLYTMSASYAAVCGSIPIVVPEPDLSKEAWVPDERDRYGIAYGVDDIPWALATRDNLLARIAQIREEQDVMLRNFVRTCHEAFCS